MKHRLLLDLPTRIETARLVVRRYQPGDGGWYFDMSRRNRAHLKRFEPRNPAMGISSPDEAEVVVRDFAVAWDARKHFFFGAFERGTGEFAAQVYAGPVSWDTAEFEIGYFADCRHEGRGFVTEAVQGVCSWLFEHLGARRLTLRCDDTNPRSAAVAERCGFRREGHVREDHARGDGYTGTLHYGQLKKDLAPRPSRPG
jgi:RimJ/RimL family protein N-acetyltransferase